jgi:hypothetical protein
MPPIAGGRSMKKRCLTMIALMLIGTCLALVVLAMLPPRPGVTKANFDRIEKEMTRVEVEEIFGKPSTYRFAFGSGTGTRYIELWRNVDGSYASISTQGDVIHSVHWHDSIETITEKLRRWSKW